MKSKWKKSCVRFPALSVAAVLSLGLASAASLKAQNCTTMVSYKEKKSIVETAVAAGSFKTLVAAVQAAGLVDTLSGPGPFTVFAPTDDAFAKLPEGSLKSLLRPEAKGKLGSILTYHVVAGRLPAAKVVKAGGFATVNGQRAAISKGDGGVRIDGARIVKTDIECSNGIIHVIDAVILPESGNLLSLLQRDGRFSTLIAAAKAGGLAGALMGESPLTVFAPTDAAFAKLPEGTVASLLRPENKDKLVSILKYHVAAGRAFSESVVSSGKVGTLQGSKVKITLKNGCALADGATITKTDLNASNGVAHVIDSVLIPPKKETGAAESGRRIIRLAIERGAPLFNGGQPTACAAVYEVALESLVAMSESDVPDSLRQNLERALSQARHTRDASQRAWTLRHALDDAYGAM